MSPPGVSASTTGGGKSTPSGACGSTPLHGSSSVCLWEEGAETAEMAGVAGRGGGGGGSTYAHEGIGCWPDDDEVPETVMRMVACFYEEMWPVLVSSCDRYALYLKRFTTS